MNQQIRRRHGAVAAIVALLVALLAALTMVQTVQAEETRSYMVCTDAPWAPFLMVNEGDIFGFDIDIMRAVAAVEGFDVAIHDMAFDDIIPSLRHGACDIGASGFSVTGERQRLIYFSEPYYVTNQALLIRKSSRKDALAILTGEGATSLIGAVGGSSGAMWIEDQLIGQGYEVRRKLYDGYSGAIEALLAGKLDAVIEDVLAAQVVVAEHADQLMIAGLIRTQEHYAFAVPPGDPENLLPRINAGMTKLGLERVDGAAGRQLRARPGSPWQLLVGVYSEADAAVIVAAWRECGRTILGASDMADVRSYAHCMAQATENSS